MESETSIENRLEELCTVLERLQQQTAYMRSRYNLKDDLEFIEESIVNISNGLSVLRKHLDQSRENNDSCQKLLLLYQKLSKKVLHMYTNISGELIETYVNYNKNESSSNVVSHRNDIYHLDSNNENQHKNVDFDVTLSVQKSTIQDCKKVLFNEPDSPKVSLLTKEEFDKIPKYMIGRQTLQMINSLVNSINQVLKAKYNLLSAGKVAARKKGDLNLYLHYKKQDIICESSGCTYFFTAEDYERYTKQKLDRAALKLLTALRHCNRIREYRSKKELYYIILT